MSLKQAKTEAVTLDELLSYYDEHFINCAYHTLLDREPDPEGMRYYLTKIRAGVSKEEILAQMRLCPEGKKKKITLAGLDKKIRYYKLRKLPLIGFLFRYMGFYEPDRNMLKKIRAVDNYFHGVDENLQIRFKQIDLALDLIQEKLNRLDTQIEHKSNDLNHLFVDLSNFLQAVKENSQKQIDGGFFQVQQRDGYFNPDIATEDSGSNVGRSTIVCLPDGWPTVSADASQVAEMLTCLEERLSGQYIKVGKFKGARNRHPYRMMAAGEKVEQYFVASESILSSITLYFYTFMKKNGARVRVNIYVVLPELIEHCLVTQFFEGDEIVDGGEVHLLLNQPILAAAGQLFRIEITIETLDYPALITVALSESNEDSLCTFDLGGPSKYALSFAVNQIPSHPILHQDIEEKLPQVRQHKGAVEPDSDDQSSSSTTRDRDVTIVSMPDGWPAVSAVAHQIAGMIARLEERSSAQFIKGGGFNKEARNRHPFRMLIAGEKAEQYFIPTVAVLSSLTLYFYTYMKKNGARVRVNLYVVLPELKEHCLATQYFEGDDIIDCAAVHIWLEPEISAAAGQIFRIEIIIEALDQASHITVALSESNEDTLRTFDIGGPSKYALSFGVNEAPSFNAKKYFAFVSGCPGDAFRYRCIHIGETLNRLGYGVDVFHPGEQVWNTLIENYQVVVLHRIPYDQSVAYFIAAARKACVLTIFDTDDLVFNPQLANQIDAYNAMSAPEKEVYLDGLVRYNKTLSECDMVTVSTERLEQEVRSLWPTKSVEIIRNRVSREMYHLTKEALLIPKPDSQNVIIAYFSGSKTHRKDFATCETAVLKLLEKHRNVRLLIVGHLEVPDTFANVADQINTEPFVAWRSLADLYRKVDINLAPLELDTAFTESKSELKFLEAGLLSIPTVAANMGAYAITVENGVDGILCRSPEEWFSGLEHLVLDPELRKRVGEAAREKVLRSSLTFRNGYAIQTKYHRLLNSAECLEFHRKPSIAFILRAPIAKTGGGYKKIFILANYLKNNFSVRIYVDPIAHLSEMTDEEICLYCEEHFDFDHKDVRVGHNKIDPTDIVIATNWPTAPIVESLNNARLKCYFVQDYEPSFYEEKDIYHELASKTYDLGLSVITIGDYLKNVLEVRGGWCRSIPFAIDPGFLNVKSRQVFFSKKPCSILFFARPGIPRRNFQAGVDALKRVREAYPKVNIALYGLEEYLELPFKYENLGQLSQNELALIMSGTDIHLSYSLTNISTVIYEAMACGCACVEADVEPVRVMVQDGRHCLLAEPSGLGTFHTLSRLIDSPSLRRELSRNGQAFAKSLTEKNMCMHFQDHLEEAWMLN